MAAQPQCRIGSGTLWDLSVLDGTGAPGLDPAPGAVGIWSPAYAQILPPAGLTAPPCKNAFFLPGCASTCGQERRSGFHRAPSAATSQGVPGEAVSFSDRLQS